MYSKDEILKCFSQVPADQMTLIEEAVDEYLYFKSELNRLQKLPLIKTDKKNPERQMITPAGKQIPKISNIVDAKRAVLLRIISKNSASEYDELLEEFKKFE